MAREKLGSRLGFILLSAGCAIGIGNVWKFPYLVGQYGGAVFVVCYLVCLLLLGIPVVVMEFAVGRAAGKSPVRMYQELEPAGSKWHWHGYVCMAANYLLMMYYTTVAGWMLYYLYISVRGDYARLSAEQVAGVFSSMLSSPAIMCGCMAAVVIVGFLILSRGLKNGLERVTKVMMLLLLLLIVVLAVHSICIEGGSAGLRFYLHPDFSRIKDVGFGKVIVEAMKQAFFTLSIGCGAMAIFGSYIDKKHSLLGESVNVTVMDTFVAVCSGMIIFPACTAYNVNVGAGPSLLFITLPNVFNHIAGGRIWGSLFFLFMVFAAFSTVLAVFENIVSMCMDLFSWSRQTCYVNIPVMIVLSLPCALGYNVLANIEPMGKGTQILDLEDFIVSNWLLPLGSLIFVLFCALKKGWGWEAFTAEANAGSGWKVNPWMRSYLTFVLPVIILVIFAAGLW